MEAAISKLLVKNYIYLHNIQKSFAEKCRFLLQNGQFSYLKQHENENSENFCLTLIKVDMKIKMF